MIEILLLFKTWSVGTEYFCFLNNFIWTRSLPKFTTLEKKKRAIKSAIMKLSFMHYPC